MPRTLWPGVPRLGATPTARHPSAPPSVSKTSVQPASSGTPGGGGEASIDRMGSWLPLTSTSLLPHAPGESAPSASAAMTPGISSPAAAVRATSRCRGHRPWASSTWNPHDRRAPEQLSPGGRDDEGDRRGHGVRHGRGVEATMRFQGRRGFHLGRRGLARHHQRVARARRRPLLKARRGRRIHRPGHGAPGDRAPGLAPRSRRAPPAPRGPWARELLRRGSRQPPSSDAAPSESAHRETRCVRVHEDGPSEREGSRGESRPGVARREVEAEPRMAEPRRARARCACSEQARWAPTASNASYELREGRPPRRSRSASRVHAASYRVALGRGETGGDGEGPPDQPRLPAARRGDATRARSSTRYGRPLPEQSSSSTW